MAALLIFPPLTSVVADGLGIDLTHHHCESHGHDAEPEATHDLDADSHDAAESDPFQCDQCHIVMAALGTDWALSSRFLMSRPGPGVLKELSSIRTLPAFKPPIA